MTRANLIRSMMFLSVVTVLVIATAAVWRQELTISGSAARPTAGSAQSPTAGRDAIGTVGRAATSTAGPAAIPTTGHSHDSVPGSGGPMNEPGHRSTPGWLGNVPGFGGIAPDETPAGVPVRLSDCTITNPLFKDDPARVRPFVPARYELGTNGFFGPGVATIIAGVLDCGGVSVEGRSTGPTVLTLIAVQVTADSSNGDLTDAAWDFYNRSTLNFLPSSSWYLIAAHTDNGTLARRLRQARLPVVHVPDLAYSKDYDGPLGSSKSDVVNVPRGHEGYTLATSTTFPDRFTHNHDWFFWFDLPNGRTGFLLHLHAMEDSSCGYHLSQLVQVAHQSCGAKLTAQPDSQVANFLGAAVRETPFAFNHPPSRPGYIALPAPPRSVERREPESR